MWLLKDDASRDRFRKEKGVVIRHLDKLGRSRLPVIAHCDELQELSTK